MGDDDPKPTNGGDQNEEHTDDEPLPGLDDDAGTVGAELDEAGESGDSGPISESLSDGSPDPSFESYHEGSLSDDDPDFGGDQYDDLVESFERRRESARQTDRRVTAAFQREREARRARVEARRDRKRSEAEASAESGRRRIAIGSLSFLIPLSLGSVILAVAIVAVLDGDDSTEDAVDNGANVPASVEETQEVSEAPTGSPGDAVTDAAEGAPEVAAAEGAPEVAGPPDGSHFVEVIEGSATGGNIWNLDGTHVGPNNDSLPFFLVRTPSADSSQGLILVPDPPKLADGAPALGLELFQDQRQGCGATPETTTFIDGIVSGLASNGDSVGCLQLYDPTQPATIFFYVVTGDTIADFSSVIEPDTLPALGSIEFADGIGSFLPPDGLDFGVLLDFDGDGVPELYDWVTGAELGAGLQPTLTGSPSFAIVDLSGATDGDALLINLDLAGPLDPAPDVVSAGLAFRLDLNGTSLLGGAQFIDGTLFTGVTCLPVPEDCSPIEAEAIHSADKTQWTIRFVPPPEVSWDPGTVQMSASAFYQDTADSPEFFQQYPEEGSKPFQE